MRPRDDLELQLWKTEENDDPLTVRMKAAISNLEAVCHPAMDARDTAGRSPCDRLLAWLTGWPSETAPGAVRSSGAAPAETGAPATKHKP